MARTWLEYSRKVMRDDIYGTARKALSVFFMGRAIALPRARRARWMSSGLTYSRAKEWLRRLTRRLSRSR